jgi:alpha-tubulin suppressor-like RCC1 family protein
MPNIKRGMMGAAGVVSDDNPPGELWAWGSNSSGSLGDGTSNETLSPIQVGSAATWTYVAAGTEGKFALGISAGKLFAWGGNGVGQLGVGNTTGYSSPVQVGSRTDWEKCFAAHGHAAAITSDGDLFMWGFNNHGQLGNGNTTNLSSPVQVAGTWTTFGGHYGISHGIKDGGTLWGWGRGNGVLGLGNTTAYSSPVQVGSLTTWSTIGSGYAVHAIKTDGTLWGWGIGSYGMIGNGATTNLSSPVQIGSLTTWRDVTGGRYKAFAVTTADTMFVWGWGANGQLGLGNTTDYSSPVQLGSLTTFSKVGRKDGHVNGSHIITTAGALWGWGYNSGTGSVIGDGTNIDRSSPVQIGSLTTWIMTADGQSFTLGIKSA